MMPYVQTKYSEHSKASVFETIRTELSLKMYPKFDFYNKLLFTLYGRCVTLPLQAYYNIAMTAFFIWLFECRSLMKEIIVGIPIPNVFATTYILNEIC